MIEHTKSDKLCEGVGKGPPCIVQRYAFIAYKVFCAQVSLDPSGKRLNELENLAISCLVIDDVLDGWPPENNESIVNVLFRQRVVCIYACHQVVSICERCVHSSDQLWNPDLIVCYEEKTQL